MNKIRAKLRKIIKEEIRRLNEASDLSPEQKAFFEPILKKVLKNWVTR